MPISRAERGQTLRATRDGRQAGQGVSYAAVMRAIVSISMFVAAAGALTHAACESDETTAPNGPASTSSATSTGNGGNGSGSGGAPAGGGGTTSQGGTGGAGGVGQGGAPPGGPCSSNVCTNMAPNGGCRNCMQNNCASGHAACLADDGSAGGGGSGGNGCVPCADVLENGGDPAALCTASALLFDALQQCACAGGGGAGGAPPGPCGSF